MKSFSIDDLSKHIGIKGLFLFLDFDGTLSRLVPDPQRARMLPGLRKILKRLSSDPHVRIMIISGRSLSDIRERVGIPSLIYAGNHGFEIFLKNRCLLRKGEKYKTIVRWASALLENQLKGIPGVIIEPKGLSVAVHFRNTPRGSVSTMRKAVATIAQLKEIKKKLALTSGKKIYELRPHRIWNKGSAVIWAWQRLAPTYLPICIGDDVTDEDAFRALGKKGLTIRVGRSQKSEAQYYVRRPEDMVKLLGRIDLFLFNNIFSSTTTPHSPNQ